MFFRVPPEPENQCSAEKVEDEEAAQHSSTGHIVSNGKLLNIVNTVEHGYSGTFGNRRKIPL